MERSRVGLRFGSGTGVSRFQRAAAATRSFQKVSSLFSATSSHTISITPSNSLNINKVTNDVFDGGKPGREAQRASDDCDDGREPTTRGEFRSA